jgi:hypothetical protein
MKPGRKRNPRRQYWMTKFGLSERQAKRIMPETLDWLDRCKDDASRRILLGVSK